MPTSAYVIGFLVVALTALFAVAYHFVPLLWAFRATDAHRRAEAIRREADRLRAELRAAESPPVPVPASVIREEAFDEGLRSVSIDALTSYPGIGDGTAQRLAAAGFRSLWDAGRLLGSFSVPGIGPSRANDVGAAVRGELLRQRERFDAGIGPYAKRADAEVTRRSAERDATVARNEASAARLRPALRDLQPCLEAAAKVTFWAYLRHHRAAPDQPWPYDPVLDAALPAVESPGRHVASPVAPPPPPVTAVDLPRLPARLPASVEAVATILYAVARADGRLAAAERVAVRRGLAKFFESDPVLVRFIDPALERFAVASLDLNAALRLAVTLARRDRDLLRQCADEVAGATGTRHAAKDRLLARLGQALTVPGEAPVPPPVAQPTGLRSNELLDGLFAGPAAPVSAAGPVAAAGGLRDNALLDDVFGG